MRDSGELTDPKNVIEAYLKEAPPPVPSLNDNDRRFLRNVYSTDFGIYRDRIEALQFTNKTKVLDLGSGFGQWSIVLARCNKNVLSVDNQVNRLRCAKSISGRMNIDNIFYFCGTGENIGVRSGEVQGVFCYSSIHFMHEKRFLEEVYRVLESGGLFYLNFNCIGWYLNLLISRGIFSFRKRSLRKSLKAIGNYIRNRFCGYHVIDPERLLNLMKEMGFEILRYSGEGNIDVSSEGANPTSFYQESYFGLPGVKELIAEKKT